MVIILLQKKILHTSEAVDKITLDVVKLRELVKSSKKDVLNGVDFLSSGGYEIRLDPRMILVAMDILGIENDTVIGYCSSPLKPLYIYNDNNELCYLLPIKKD